MIEKANNQAEAAEDLEKAMNEESPEERKKAFQNFTAKYKEQIEERKERYKNAQEAMAEGKGRLELETPFLAGDEEIKELIYDFNELTGIEYTDAMDSDINAQQIYRITYRQALALFAKAAAKQTDKVDTRDIMERIGMTDAIEAVQLATLFFSASTRAGRLRISKR